MMALLALAGDPVRDGAAIHPGDIHDRYDIGLQMRQIPGAAGTADYVLRDDRAKAASQPATGASAPARTGGGRYVF